MSYVPSRMKLRTWAYHTICGILRKFIIKKQILIWAHLLLSLVSI